MNDAYQDRYWQHEAAKFASYYKTGARFSLKRFVSLFLESRSHELLGLAGIGPEDDVLDVGCGSGVHVRHFSPACRSITGVDYSPGMIEAARELMKSGQTRNWQLMIADAHQLPFPDASFTKIISLGLLDYVSSPEKVLQECCRVLRRPGQIVFSMPKTPSLFFWLRTPVGIAIREKLFDLPRIKNAASKAKLESLVSAMGLQQKSCESVWTTMWMIQAVKN